MWVLSFTKNLVFGDRYDVACKNKIGEQRTLVLQIAITSCCSEFFCNSYNVNCLKSPLGMFVTEVCIGGIPIHFTGNVFLCVLLLNQILIPAHSFHCNNFVYSETIFIIFGTYTV